ncbi:MAG TPA: nucleotide sugar dehydrogenase [Candidatus Acidoferrum sp.]|nr:nucleotide sugar dehydrogenase [Candidatus Acidoferrum sp.]
MTASTLTDRVRTTTAHIAVIGQGYVGLPLAVEFARAGFTVTGIDTDLDRITRLNTGSSYIPDVDSGVLRGLVAEGRYSATEDPNVLGAADVVIICVPTPLRKSKDPDISFVMASAEQVAERLRAGQLVVLESTTYPGTTEELLLPRFEATGLRAGQDFYLAFSPERIDPANPTFTVRDIPKIVGGVTPACSDMAALLYGHIVPRVLRVSSARAAELAKLYENIFRNVNIALANEFALMCSRLGVSSKEVIDAAASKPFGFMAFYPGPGIGGHCIPVDPLYLTWKMRLNGYEPRMIHVADEINRSMPAHVVDLVAEALNGRRQSLNGARVLVLGVAYKRGVGDTRESPAIDVIERLHAKGAEVAYADPYVPSIAIGSSLLKSVDLDQATLAGADCVLILTDHPQFPYERVVREAALVVDPRNATFGIPAPQGRIVRL